MRESLRCNDRARQLHPVLWREHASPPARFDMCKADSPVIQRDLSMIGDPDQFRTLGVATALLWTRLNDLALGNPL